MKKLILAMILTLALPTAAMAHSQMETSVPEDGATVTEPLEEVVLTFSAGIEDGSTLTLTGSDGEIEFTTIIIEGDRMTGTLAEPLPDGEWTIGWNVVSEDGHPIDGEITFEAAAGITADSAEEEEETVPEDTAAADEETDTEPAGDGDQVTEESPADEGTGSDQSEEGGSVFLTVGLLVIVLVLLGLIFRALRRKK